jgi:molybdate transport system ATP-binding protein
MNKSALFSFTDATIKRFGTTIFTQLHFSVRLGEHWAITGGSGSGKTSLLDAIAGNLNVVNGEFDHTLLDEYVVQRKGNDPLFSWCSLIGLVLFKHTFRNLSNTTTFYYQQRFNASDSEDAETVEAYLSAIKPPAVAMYWTYEKVIEKFKLLSLKDKHLIKLSNGETKRLLLAAALIKNPLILLLDNPFTGLDVAMRKELDALLNEIAASGITIIMATTSTEIPDVITHVAVLDQQHIVSSTIKEKFVRNDAKLSPTFDIIELNALRTMNPQPLYRTLVEMKDVVIRYDDKMILDRINWRIMQGERWALIGHNGAGKSTLLSLINGDNPQAYANDIVLFDRPRGSGESIWDIKQKIGFVSPELFQYFPSDQLCVQVIESGFYDTPGLLRKSYPENATLAKRWMKLLGIEEMAALPFRRASTGIQRLSLLIRALVKNPALLILDEPCQGLDEQQQCHFKQVINELCRSSNVSMIYVSHYEHEIPVCVKKVLELKQGRSTFN